MKKQFPAFKSDKEAEDFVATADLSAYDFSDMKPMRFELRRKDTSISLRLPEQLLNAVRSRAAHEDMPYQRYIRMVLEQALAQPKP